MISFPNIKINLGLNIVSKRSDGYHNIETVFYPVPYYDIIEILPSKEFELINEGIKIDCPVEKNLCYKAFKLIYDKYDIDPVKIYLYKNVPFGSGLGSGSSDAASTLLLLNDIFDLHIDEDALLNLSSEIGADCAFFIRNMPVIATGIGNIFKNIDLRLDDMYLLLCFPGISINTALAYKNCIPSFPEKRISQLIELPIEEWKYNLKNDFEMVVFRQFPLLEEIKSELYEKGAVYAQMSGSGSSIFGLFRSEPKNIHIKNCENIKILKLK